MEENNDTQDYIKKAQEAAKRLEEANKKSEELLKKIEYENTRKIFSGETNAGTVSKSPEQMKEEDIQRQADKLTSIFKKKE